MTARYNSALAFAKRVHHGQVRKATKVPLYHPSDICRTKNRKGDR